MQTVTTLNGCTILSFLPRPSGSPASEKGFQPHSIQRTSDFEVFTIGDLVTNQMGMRGNIVCFDLLDGRVFIKTTWSGVGYSIEAAIKVQLLPSKHQVYDQVYLEMAQADYILNGTGKGSMISFKVKANVLAVHFLNKKEKYDLEIEFSKEPGDKTRIYAVDSKFVTKLN